MNLMDHVYRLKMDSTVSRISVRSIRKSVLHFIFTIDNRHPYLDWKHMCSAHTKLCVYLRCAPKVLKHSFSFEDSVLWPGYS